MHESLNLHGILQRHNEGRDGLQGRAFCSGTLRGSPKQPGPQLLTATAWQALAVKLVWHDCCPDGQVRGAAHLHIATQCSDQAVLAHAYLFMQETSPQIPAA